MVQCVQFVHTVEIADLTFCFARKSESFRSLLWDQSFIFHTPLWRWRWQRDMTATIIFLI